MRVTFLILGKYPTQKAYGITTSETIRCLNLMGHEVTVFSTYSNTDEAVLPKNYISVNYKESWFSTQLRESAYTSFSFFSMLAWHFYWSVTKIKNSELIANSNADVVWVRDYRALKLAPKKSNLIFEVHQQPKKSWKLSRMNDQSFKRLVVAPISARIQRTLSEHYPHHSFLFSPMGIRSDQLFSYDSESEFSRRIEELKARNLEEIRIGYIGKFFPNGYSKGVEDLLELALLNKKLDLRFCIAVKGGHSHEVERLKSLALQRGLEEKDLEISGHMNHSLALTEMSKLDVIVLTSPTSSNYVGFPLKALESVASGRVVVAADCQTYRDIFNADFKPYWYSPEKPEDLLKTISMAVSDPDLKESIRKGRDFASLFLWENRTENLINAIKK
jgi:glycosyltransferase involved in cell wall biosynthesis